MQRLGPSFGMHTTEMIAGITPMRTSLKLNCADATEKTMSAAPTRPRPPANAAPLTATITGFGPSMIEVSTSG